MTLKQLEAFYWAAKLGTFAIAAQRLHVTQSSLSKRIAELESDLGEALFDRTSKRASLTAAGENLLSHAKHMLEIEQAIRSSLTDSSTDLHGVCRFGLSELSSTTWFPAFAGRLRSDHPDLVLDPQVGLARPMERLVERGELDFAVVAGAPTIATLASQPVAELDFVWTSSPSRLKRGTLLRAAQFQEHPVISFSTQDSGLTAAFGSWVAAHDVKVRNVISCNSLNAIVALTVTGVGISFLPRQYISPLVKRGLLVALKSDPPLPAVSYSFIWRRDDNRRLVNTMKTLLVSDTNFSVPNVLWAV
jgi:DNA-binding transcriptional LysR family regulator